VFYGLAQLTSRDATISFDVAGNSVEHQRNNSRSVFDEDVIEREHKKVTTKKAKKIVIDGFYLVKDTHIRTPYGKTTNALLPNFS
jgi:hypothetical protein